AFSLGVLEVQNCILPCNVDPSSDTIIHWDHLTSGEHNVHSYYDTEDQLGRQDQQFKGRTSLFQDLISRGNGSLRLTGVKIQDEGRYSCYSSTERGSRKTFIQLKVEDLPLLFLMCLFGWFAALITEVSIKLVENRIICSSEWIYPQPELTHFLSNKMLIHTL
uniref:Ig-like domain-containing protein n=1 Tax=Poecilia latipinna TaxID=48699 RepID=A0A3B3UB87_9TELE